VLDLGEGVEACSIWHREIEQDHIGLEARRFGDGFVAVACFAHDAEAGAKSDDDPEQQAGRP
jgi:hypothetical protein